MWCACLGLSAAGRGTLEHQTDPMGFAMVMQLCLCLCLCCAVLCCDVLRYDALCLHSMMDLAKNGVCAVKSKACAFAVHQTCPQHSPTSTPNCHLPLRHRFPPPLIRLTTPCLQKGNKHTPRSTPPPAIGRGRGRRRGRRGRGRCLTPQLRVRCSAVLRPLPSLPLRRTNRLTFRSCNRSLRPLSLTHIHTLPLQAEAVQWLHGHSRCGSMSSCTLLSARCSRTAHCSHSL